MSEFRTRDMDIYRLLGDNALRDMMAEEDRSGLIAVNAIMGGAGASPESAGDPETRQDRGSLPADGAGPQARDAREETANDNVLKGMLAEGEVWFKSLPRRAGDSAPVPPAILAAAGAFIDRDRVATIVGLAQLPPLAFDAADATPIDACPDPGPIREMERSWEDSWGVALAAAAPADDEDAD